MLALRFQLRGQKRNIHFNFLPSGEVEVLKFAGRGLRLVDLTQQTVDKMRVLYNDRDLLKHLLKAHSLRFQPANTRFLHLARFALTSRKA